MSNLWYTDHRKLSRGSKGPDVIRLQRRLNTDGANPLVEPDGVFGQNTEAEVHRFQRMNKELSLRQD